LILDCDKDEVPRDIDILIISSKLENLSPEIQSEIRTRIKKRSVFYHLLKSISLALQIIKNGIKILLKNLLKSNLAGVLKNIF